MPIAGLDAKMGEAHKQLQGGNLEGCLKTLEGLPMHDPKVVHNHAVVEYLFRGGNAADVLKKLEYVPSIPNQPSDLALKEDASRLANVVGELYYEGHETAHFNRAVVMLHNNMVDDAIAVLRDLLSREPPVDKLVRAHAAFALQMATNPIGRRKFRVQEDEETINKAATDCLGDIDKNPYLKRLFTLAFADNSSLHEWFKGSSNDVADTITYYNNLGNLALCDGKLHLASVYFSNAMKACSGLPEGSTSVSKLTLHSVMYNAGVCALMRRQYPAALASLIPTFETMKGSALLWCRITQAALGWHVAGASLPLSAQFAEHQNAIAAEIMSTGKLIPSFPLLQLPGTSSLYGNPFPAIARSGSSATPSANGKKGKGGKGAAKKGGEEGEDVGPTPSEVPSFALDIAIRAVDNALCILVPSGKNVAATAKLLAAAGKSSQLKILQHVLLFACFIELQRHNYSVAASIGADLIGLNVKEHPLAADILATAITYTVEALCMLNRPMAALKILQMMNVSEIVTPDASADSKMRVEALFVNLVIAHIANGSWKSAHVLVTNLLNKFSGPEVEDASRNTVAKCATLLQVFIELAQGKREKAVEYLSSSPVYPPLL